MKILIRADANKSIGMGHIMRCLSIADAFTEFGHDIKFLIADDCVSHFLLQHGYATTVLHSNYQKMDEELEFWPSLDGINIVIIDSYHVTESYLQLLKQAVNKLDGKLVYIDDLATFPYMVDIIVNYNAYGPNLDYQSLYQSSGIPEPHLILGPTYAPLRSVFHGVAKKEQPKNVQNVLISTGGADSEHIALSIARARPSHFTYHFLLGALNSDREAIRELTKNQEHIVLHENVTDMKSLISEMDIAVSAAGSTLYEICVCGVPFITYVLADNQIPGAEAFDKLELSNNLGDMREPMDPASIIISAVDKLAKDYDRRVATGKRMQEMIDGFGAERMVKEILSSCTMIRTTQGKMEISLDRKNENSLSD